MVFKAVALILLLQMVFFQTVRSDVTASNLSSASRNARYKFTLTALSSNESIVPRVQWLPNTIITTERQLKERSQSLGDPDLPYPPTNPFPIQYGLYTLKVNINQPVINIPAWNLGPCMVNGLGTACDNLQRNPQQPLYRGRYTCTKSSVRLTVVSVGSPPMTYHELANIIRAMDDFQHRYRMVQMDFGLWSEGRQLGTGSAKLDFDNVSVTA